MQSSYVEKTKNNRTIVSTSIRSQTNISLRLKDDVIDQQFELSSMRNTCDERAYSSVINKKQRKMSSE